MIRFSLTTLGCKANQYDGAALSQFLCDGGATRCDDASADLVVINTCCVTAQAMRKSRQAIRRALAAAPAAAVLVTGCYSDYHAARIEGILDALGVEPRRRAVVGHHGDYAACCQRVLHALSGHVNQAASFSVQVPRADLAATGRATQATGPTRRTLTDHGNPGNATRNDVWMRVDVSRRVEPSGSNALFIKSGRLRAVKEKAPGSDTLGPLRRFQGHQRAFVKVQDGCDAFCSYCIVPYTRSLVRSRSDQAVVSECRDLLAAGHKELVLSGVFLGAYGRDTAIRRRWTAAWSPLANLVRQVAALDGLWRLRLSSLEPLDLDEDLLGAWSEGPRLAPHFHLPLQSGSDRVLRRMNRQYSADQFRRVVDRLRERLDRPALTTDVIVGFPGEQDDDFARTLEMARHAGFAKIHAFPFSAIEGTAAWLMRRDAPPKRIVRERMAELARVERELAAAYRGQFVGQTVEALVDGESDCGLSDKASFTALTDRYLTVRFAAAGEPSLLGQVVRLRLQKVTEEGMDGSLAV